MVGRGPMGWKEVDKWELCVAGRYGTTQELVGRMVRSYLVRYGVFTMTWKVTMHCDPFSPHRSTVQQSASRQNSRDTLRPNG